MTKNSKSLKSFKATAGFKVFQASENKDIRALSSDEITEAGSQAVFQEKRTQRIDLILGLLAAVLCIALTTWVVMIAPTNRPYFEQGFGISATVLALFALKEVNDYFFKGVPEFVRALQPLHELEKCERALTLAKKFPACNKYRESVLGQGREFLALDLKLMERIAKNVEAETRSDRTLKACKELHGITA